MNKDGIPLLIVGKLYNLTGLNRLKSPRESLVNSFAVGIDLGVLAVYIPAFGAEIGDVCGLRIGILTAAVKNYTFYVIGN